MRLLLNWDYTRKDYLAWLLPATAGADVTFLVDDPHAPPSPPGLRVRQRREFSSPAALLRELAPDKILFSDIEMFSQVALNAVARSRGIRTYLLDHGLRLADNINEAYQVDAARGHFDASVWKRRPSNSLRTLAFYAAALPEVGPLAAMDMLRFVPIRARRELLVALVEHPFEMRRPDRYITFCMASADFYMRRDVVPLDRFDIVGNPAFDAVLGDSERCQAPQVAGDYFLLIDSPLTEQAIFGVSKEEKARCLDELNRFCLRQSAKLVVKLHPHSFHSALWLEDPNIEYVRDTPFRPLLEGARGCFGFLSTIMTAAPLLTPCVVIRVIPNSMQDDLVASGMAGALDFRTFTAQDVTFSPREIGGVAMQRHTEKYLGRADGRASQRIREILFS